MSFSRVAKMASLPTRDAPPPLSSLSPRTTPSADYDRNGRLGLIELTRVIELYNTRSGTSRTGEYSVIEGSEDGFTPGSGISTLPAQVPAP